MAILFLQDWHPVPGVVKPSYPARDGREVINPRQDDNGRFPMIIRLARSLLMAAIGCLSCIPTVVARQADTPAGEDKALPIPGTVFRIDGHTAFLILPDREGPTGGRPWVWYAPTLPGLPGAEERWMFERFLEAGIAIAGIDVGESYGSPRGRAAYSSFHEEMVRSHGLSTTPCLLARSRGGLMLYNWAAEHPDSVACIAEIYPVCDLRSYPGLDRASGAYGMTPERLSEVLALHNPVDRVESLARAGVPVFHLHGDDDAVVPLESNSAELARRYRQFGGEMTLRVIEGQGHTMWPGWFQSQELVDFVIAHAKGGG